MKVVSCMKGVSVLELPTTDEDSGSEEEATTHAPRKTVMKSGKVCTVDTTVISQDYVAP